MSGSDDTHVSLWNLGREKKNVHHLRTGHSLNIFCVRFMPSTGQPSMLLESVSAPCNALQTGVCLTYSTTLKRCCKDFGACLSTLP